MTNLADGVAVVVWAWVASIITRDPFLIALMPFALRLPWFLLALPAGIITDRVNRRRLILNADVARALVFAGVAVILTFAPQSLEGSDWLYAILLCAAFLIGVAEVFRDNAAQTILPSIIAPDELEKANARLWSVELVGNAMLGPALGAFLIATVIWLPFAANAVAFLVAVALISTIQTRETERTQRARDWRAELREGWIFLMDAPLLKLLAVITGVWNLMHQMVVIALVLHVQENLGLEVTAYGLILAAGAVGGVAGGLVAERGIKWMGPGAAAQWSSLASVISFAAIPFAPNAVALAAVLFFFEFTGIFWNTVSVSYRQRTVPDALLGRVNSIYRLLAWGTMPIGLLLSGALVTWSEAVLSRGLALEVPFLLAALGTGILTAMSWRPLGRGFADP